MLEEINKNIYLLEKNIWNIRSYFKEIFVDSYIVTSGSFVIIIDSGLKSSLDNFREVLDKINFNKIFLISTHSHWDHTGSGQDIKHKYGAFLIGHINGERYFNNPELQWPEIFNNPENILKPSDLDREVFFNEISGGIKNDLLVNNNEIFVLNNNQYKILHTPGHSGCSLSVYDVNNQYLYSGDLLSGSGINDGIVIINNYSDYIDSINKIKDIRLKKIFTSHKSVIEEGQIDGFLEECLSELMKYKEILISLLKIVKKSTYKELIEKFSLKSMKKKNLFLEITLRSLLVHLMEEKVIDLNNNFYIFKGENN